MSVGTYGVVNSQGFIYNPNTLSWEAATGVAGGGDASAANQVTGNNSLASIDGKLPALSGGRIPVVLPAGGSGLTDAELRASAIEVDVTNASIPVTGTFWQATQPISGSVTVSEMTDDATRDNGKIDVASLDQYTPVSGRLPVDGSGVTQPVSGTFWQATQPVSGTVTSNAGSGTFTTKEVRSATPTQSSVNDSASSVTILASNANRLGASIYNDSSEALYLKLGATASTTSFSVKMASQSYYEVPFGYTGVIDGIWNADSTGAARITELTA